MKKGRRVYQSSDGTVWIVDVRSPSSSSAMIHFRHPAAHSSRMDRYNWCQWTGPEAAGVTSTLSPAAVLASLSDEDLAAFFRRSMPVHTSRAPVNLIARTRSK